MNVFQINLTGYVVAVDKPAALARGGAVADAARARGVEPGPTAVREVPDKEVDLLPAAVRRLLERETRNRYGQVASSVEIDELRQAVLATNGGQIDMVTDELAAAAAAFGYVPQTWALQRTHHALQRATTPEATRA